MASPGKVMAARSNVTAADTWLKAFNKRAGEQLAIMASGPGIEVEVIPTGVLALDAALGIGGWPRGRVVELSGPDGSGKTTLALLAVAQAQAMNLPAVYIDSEHKLDLRWAQNLGVDLRRMGLCQPSSGEAGFKALKTLIDVGGGIAIVDSVTTMTPQSVIDANEEDKNVQPARLAALMSSQLALLAGGGQLARTKTLVIFLNQQRSKVGLVFGNPIVTTGGNALKFYSVCRVEFLAAQKIEGPTPRGKDVVGTLQRAKVIKNQVAPPFRHADWRLTRTGLDRGTDLVDTGVHFGVLRRGTKGKGGKSQHTIVFTEDGALLGAGADRISVARAAGYAAIGDVAARIRAGVLEAVNATDVPLEEVPEVDEVELEEEEEDHEDE